MIPAAHREPKRVRFAAMQLPLSASALVLVGVGAVVAGVLILLALAVRRRARRTDVRVRPALAAAQPSSARAAGAHDAMPPVAVPAAAATLAGGASAPAAAPSFAESAAIGMPAAGHTPGARVDRAPEVAPSVAGPGQVNVGPLVSADAGQHAGAAVGEHPLHADPRPVVGSSLPQVQPAGPGRTVAAAVAQAFAVRAAASRGENALPGYPVDAAPPAPVDPVEMHLPTGGMPAHAPTSGNPALPDEPLPQVDRPADPWADGAVTDDSLPTDPSLPTVDPLPRAAWTEPAVTGAEPAGWPAVAEQHLPDTNGSATEPGPNGAEPATAPAASTDGPQDDAASHPSSPDGDGDGRLPAVQGLWATGWSAVPVPVTPPAAEPEPPAVPVPRPEPVLDGAAPGPSAAEGATEIGARDRLLAVLLDDPERAVGAVVELESCQRELERLSDAVRHERGALSEVLHRLVTAGLRPDQLARLAGMPLADVEAMLGDAPADQQAHAVSPGA